MEIFEVGKKIIGVDSVLVWVMFAVATNSQVLVAEHSGILFHAHVTFQ